MFRNADSIEEAKSLKSESSGDGTKSSRRGKHANSRANLKPYPKGVSGNPGGRPKVDVAALIARAVLEENQEAAYKALGAALMKGNAYVFKELAERAYGKMKDSAVIEHTGTDGAPLSITIKLVKPDGDSK